MQEQLVSHRLFLTLGVMFVAGFFSPYDVFAGQAIKPVPGQYVASAYSARNLAAAKKPGPIVKPRFFNLAQAAKTFPLRRPAAPGANPVAEEIPVASEKTLPQGTMTREQANQILSLFADAD